MAFDLNKKEEKKKFDLSKSKDAAEVNLSKEKANPSSRPDLTKKRYIVPKADPVKKEAATHITDLNKEKSKSIPKMAYLLGTAILATGIWYFIAASESETVPTASTKATANPPAPAPVTTPAVTNPSQPAATGLAPEAEINNDALVTAAALENKVLANFETGSSSLLSVDDATVNNLISYLSKNAGSKLTVYGFASSEGALSFNQQLSQQRADACKSYLAEKGIASYQILAVGKGIENPISSNSTQEGRMKNRRVEIVLE